MNAFADKLIELRRKKGLSQEMLADLLDVSRQAVSKWEAGRTMPDIPKLIAMADLFDVSLDELLRDKERVQAPEGPVVTGPLVAASALRYEYKSKAKLFGIPLVHICLRRHAYGPPLAVAKGIIAIGDVAVGAVALGGIAVGGISLGGISTGLLMAIGGLAVGGIALGGVAVGILAVGGLAVGMWSLGGFALAGEVAGGGFASGKVAVGGKAVGDVVFMEGSPTGSLADFQRTVLQHSPHTAKWFIRLLYHMVAP